MPSSVDHVNQLTPAASEDLLEALHAVMHRLRAQQQRGLSQGEHGLNPMEGKVLGFFARHPQATPSDLVAHSGRDKGQIARLISGLRERGLLQAQADAQDRRILRLRLTEQAQALHQVLMHERERLAELAVSTLDDRERRELLALLGKVRRSLDSAGAQEAAHPAP